MNRIAAAALTALLTFMTAAPGGSAQSIEDHFLSVPDTSLLGLSKAERKLILDIHKAPERKAQTDHGYAIEILDVKNGYLRLGGAIEGRLEMCYWKLGDGKSLVAVYQEGCGPLCYVERFDFFVCDGRSYAARNTGDVLPDLSRAFLKKPASRSLKELERRDLPANVLFRLPRRGKNIIAVFGAKRELAGAAVGNRLTLEWRGGTFAKGAVYWE